MKKTLIKLRSGRILPFALLFLLASCQKDEDLPDGPLTDLSVETVIDNQNPTIGSVVTYTVTAKNLGKNTAPEVVVTDSLPDGLQIQSATVSQGSYDAQTGKWTLGDLKKKSQLTLTIKAKVIYFGHIINKVKIGGQVTDSNSKNNNAQSEVVSSGVGLSKTQGWTCEIFSAMKDVYLWNSSLPDALNLDKYGIPENALDYLSTVKVNPETGQPIDRYSFLDKIGNLSGEITQGTSSGDYGFMVTAAYNSSHEVSFFVNYVYKNSPAGDAGVARSYEVVKINGSDAVHPGVLPTGYLDSSSEGYINMTNALFNSSSATFTFKRTDGTTLETALNTDSYDIKSVLCDSIYNVDSRKVGYMVFNKFLGKTAQTEITNTLSRFGTKGVKNVVIDLRYNGGGLVETCELFSNLLAPSSATGKPMYSYKLNADLMDYYKSVNYGLTQVYSKKNTFEPNRIYFIVGPGTASAAELLINNLRPYFPGNLFLIGQTTYGKPCGFWATPIGYDEKQTAPKEGYDLYAVSFETVNVDNEGGYYEGMTPGTSKYPGVRAYDSVYLPWGDVNDGCLSQALNHIAWGTFKAAQSSPAYKVKSLTGQAISGIDRQFRGMIDFRKPTRR